MTFSHAPQETICRLYDEWSKLESLVLVQAGLNWNDGFMGGMNNHST